MPASAGFASLPVASTTHSAQIVLPEFERQRHSLVDLNEIDAARPHMSDRHGGKKLLREIGDIGPINSPRNEAKRRRTGDALHRSLALQPSEQMIGLIGERAHVANPHIKQMPRVIREIGEATADLSRRLDHNDFGRVVAQSADEMQRSEHAGSTTADYGDTHDVRPFARHRQSEERSLLFKKRQYYTILVNYSTDISCTEVEAIDAFALSGSFKG